MRALAGWCVRHRRLVVTGWLVALVGLTAISQSVGSSYKDSFSLNGTHSFDALNLLQKAAPKASGDREQIVVAVEQGKLTDPAVQPDRGDAREGRGAAARRVGRIAVRAGRQPRSRARGRSRSRT